MYEGKSAEAKKDEGPVPLIDKHNNLASAAFDLGKDGEFKGNTVVIGLFYNFEIQNTADALTQKGFDIIVCYDELNFISYLQEKGDVGIIISSGGSFINTEEKNFRDAVIAEHKKGKFIFYITSE